ncbi:MAG: ABC transporter permease [Anaerolineaceae bacterium]|nr:ABC transporter permease [Anaerolineaceae bacterium]
MDPILFIQLILTGSIRSGTSVLYAVLGETVSEKVGVVNLGTEGCMLMGACAGFIITYQTGNPWLGVLVAGLAGGLLSLAHAYLVISCGANQLASGLAMLFLGLGLTALLGRDYVKVSIEGFNPIPIPFLSTIPFIGKILFNHDIMTYVGFLIGPALWFLMYRTRWGLSIRAVGESRAVAFSTGRNPVRIAYMGVFIGGILAGLGGAQLSIAFTHFWVENMTQGAGFIAVALVIFAMWHPIRAIAGALLYGGAYSLQLTLQTMGVGIPPALLQMVPYVLTLIVLLAWSKASKRAMPAELGKAFGAQT